MAKKEIMVCVAQYRRSGQWAAALAFADGMAETVREFPSFRQSSADKIVAAAVAKLKEQATARLSV
eukprot:SAG31_NODE_904_length_11120_cov_76.575084_13_plen_66_part_00